MSFDDDEAKVVVPVGCYRLKFLTLRVSLIFVLFCLCWSYSSPSERNTKPRNSPRPSFPKSERNTDATVGGSFDVLYSISDDRRREDKRKINPMTIGLEGDIEAFPILLADHSTVM